VLVFVSGDSDVAQFKEDFAPKGGKGRERVIASRQVSLTVYNKYGMSQEDHTAQTQVPEVQKASRGQLPGGYHVLN
jgi:hypothetical protein